MKKNNQEKNNRRHFIKNASLVTASLYIIPRHVLGRGFVAPSDKITVAGIGVGGQGESDLRGIAKSEKAQIGFLCDVDARRAASSVKRFPQAKYYRDFREMFDKEYKNIDAVTVSTPDNTHAVAAIAAMCPV